MFLKLLSRYKENKALREWHRTPLGQSLAHHIHEYFTEIPRFEGMNEEDKDTTITKLYGQVREILRAQEPTLKLREELATVVIPFAELQVLCLTEEEKREAFYADYPYISGELYHHIEKATPHVELLREAKWRNPNISNDDLVGLCNMRSGRLLFYVNGLNRVRIEFKDFDDEKDWLKPFIRAMMVWHEDTLREKMGLPSLLLDRFEAVKHSTFMNKVVNGFINPYYEWEKQWIRDDHPERT